VSSGAGYVVASPVPGAVVYAVPTATTVVYVGTTPYYYYGGTYYVATSLPAQRPPAQTPPAGTPQSSPDSSAATESLPEMRQDDQNYEVVKPPAGATVPYLPEEAKEETIRGKKYFVYDGTYYQPFSSEGDVIYMVVGNPRQKNG